MIRNCIVKNVFFIVLFLSGVSLGMDKISTEKFPSSEAVQKFLLVSSHSEDLNKDACKELRKKFVEVYIEDEQAHVAARRDKYKYWLGRKIELSLAELLFFSDEELHSLSVLYSARAAALQKVYDIPNTGIRICLVDDIIMRYEVFDPHYFNVASHLPLSIKEKFLSKNVTDLRLFVPDENAAQTIDTDNWKILRGLVGGCIGIVLYYLGKKYLQYNEFDVTDNGYVIAFGLGCLGDMLINSKKSELEQEDFKEKSLFSELELAVLQRKIDKKALEPIKNE